VPKQEHDEVEEVLTRGVLEVRAGEPNVHEVDGMFQYQRFCILWMNGKRWQGYLTETEDVE
jgi:hypothetical protein